MILTTKDLEFRLMKEMDNLIDTMIKMYRIKLHLTAKSYGFTAPETVACSQELDRWILLAVCKRNQTA
jgi:hypothetical protein